MFTELGCLTNRAHQANCSWSRKSVVEEAGVVWWLPRFEITVLTILLFSVWPQNSKLFGRCCPFYLYSKTKLVDYEGRRKCLSKFGTREHTCGSVDSIHFYLFLYFFFIFDFQHPILSENVTKSEFLFFKLFSDISCSCKVGLLISWFFFIFLFCPFYF